MTSFAPRLALGALVILALLWPTWRAQAKKPRLIAVIVNKKNPVQKLSRQQIRDIFLKRRRSWESGRTIVPINNALQSALRKAFLRHVLKMSPQEEGAYWVKQSVTGQSTPPRRVGTSVLAKRLVGSLAGAISYVELSKVDDSVRIIAIDTLKPTDPEYPYRY
jgi:ABC-type phosphate transport system substrate-binding protein